VIEVRRLPAAGYADAEEDSACAEGRVCVVDGDSLATTVGAVLRSVEFRLEPGRELVRGRPLRVASALYSGRPSLELLREDEGRATFVVSKSRCATWARAAELDIGGVS
jgi:hypothetical protein